MVPPKSQAARLCAVIVFVLIAAAGLDSCLCQSFTQTSADTYTRYELLEPGSAKFRIIYDVSATTPGVEYYFNSLRAGSEHEVHAVYDRMSGGELKWEIVSGAEAREYGYSGARTGGEYLMVHLPRPVPENGEIRLRIDKTYRDTDSYLRRGDGIVFTRSLSIPRNSVVLPERYELTGCNYPSQVFAEEDGRIVVSFMNTGPESVPFTVTARLLPERLDPKRSKVVPDIDPDAAVTTETSSSAARIDYGIDERAFQDREIVYFLQQPETHSFRLYHDYTETREGFDRYLNVVRAGSRASDPSAYILDTGERLKVETLRGREIEERDIGVRNVTDETEVVVIWFDPVQRGESVRLRIWETYTDPNRYLIADDELVWDRAFGRPRNTVVLPEGWYLTANSIPAVIDMTDEGNIRLYYENPRPDRIQVFVKAKRR